MEGRIEARLAGLGIALPALPPPIGNFLPGVVHGSLIFLSGQGPMLESGEYAKGVVGSDVTVEQARNHARRAGLVLLAAARQALGSLDRVERVVNIYGLVNGAPDFSEHPAVINGCSDLMVEVFGESGRHARAAIGVGSLPMGITVELTAVMAVRSG